MSEASRIDKWLWFARLFKSRSQAAAAVEAGAVRINGAAAAKPAQPVHPGDEVVFPAGRRLRRVVVVSLGTRRGPAAEAQALYRELQPPAEAGGC